MFRRILDSNKLLLIVFVFLISVAPSQILHAENGMLSWKDTLQAFETKGTSGNREQLNNVRAQFGLGNIPSNARTYTFQAWEVPLRKVIGTRPGTEKTEQLFFMYRRAHKLYIIYASRSGQVKAALRMTSDTRIPELLSQETAELLFKDEKNYWRNRAKRPQ